jgi:hypothetical protein
VLRQFVNNLLQSKYLQDDCNEMLVDMQRSDFVKPYNSTDLLWNNASFRDSWYNETDYMNITLLDVSIFRFTKGWSIDLKSI